MSHGGFRQRLQEEFEARRARNGRYSLRAFATLLGADHSSVSQILRGTRAVPVSHIRLWAKAMGIDSEEASAYVVAAQVPDPGTVARQEHLRHWSAEAMCILSEGVHWGIVKLCKQAGFRADCRWIAEQLNVSVDEVNLALSRLLRLRLLRIGADREWRDNTGLVEMTEREFRKLALARVRQSAAEMSRKQNLCLTP